MINIINYYIGVKLTWFYGKKKKHNRSQAK